MADSTDVYRSLVAGNTIAPAGSQEEAAFAQSLSEKFHDHGLQTLDQTFSYDKPMVLPYVLVAILLAIFAVLSGLGVGPLSVVVLILGLILLGLCAIENIDSPALASFRVLSLLDQKVFAGLTGGTKGNSRNVVAHHPAMAAPGTVSHPVVVIAHYDSPKATLFSAPVLNYVRPRLRLVVTVAMCAAVACMLLQVIPMPRMIHVVAWAIAILAAVVLLFWAVTQILATFMPKYTPSANANRSGVAVVLSLLERVRPSQNLVGLNPAPAPVADPAAAAPAAPAYNIPDAVLGNPNRAAAAPAGPVRYGADAVRSLGILPPTCVIEYQDALPLESVRYASQGAPASAPAAVDPTVAIPGEPVQEDPRDEVDIIMAGIVGEAQPQRYVVPEPAPAMPVTFAGSTSAMQVAPATPVSQGWGGYNVITQSDEPDVELRSSTNLPSDIAGSVGGFGAFAAEEPAPGAPTPVNDASWGTSSFTPVGRRLLADIPDPAVAAVDPYSVGSIEPAGLFNPEDFSQLDFETGTHAPVTPMMLEDARRRSMDGFTEDFTESSGTRRNRKSKKGAKSGRLSQQAARMQAEMEEQSFTDFLGLEEGYDAKSSGRQIGSWSNFNNDQYGQQQYPGNGAPNWQGGAARARRQTAAGASNADPVVRQRAMTMADRELATHDIWFVLTGAGDDGHKGIKYFLDLYRNDLRNAFFINVESIGAGRQSLLTTEGSARRGKADRKLVNLLGDASMMIGRPLSLTGLAGIDTEATPLLLENCRCATICGVENGAPAYYGSMNDTPDKVDPGMIADVVDIIAEAIKKIPTTSRGTAAE